MQNIGHSYCKEIPLWKWILLFIGGVILLLLLYSGAQTASMAEVKTPLKVCISLVAASLLVVAYYLVAGKIEKRKVDELISTSACSWVGKGLLLGAAYSFSGNLWLPIGIHWAWNFMEGNIFGFYVSGNPENYRILTPSISGPNIYTGGNFGPEASIISIILGMFLSAWFIWRYYKFQRPSKEQ